MNEHSLPATDDAYLKAMQNSRQSPAVLKIDLVNLRAKAPGVPIFAFEGVDDNRTYSHWVRRALPGFKYEAFPCGGKKQVLQLRSVVLRDKGGIGDGVYYFVDRDFDDLQGEAPSEDVFMTAQYSIENYLVSEHALDDLLVTFLGCYSRPDIRTRVTELFSCVYEDFLKITSEINLRLFLARRMGAKLRRGLPKSIAPLSSVSLHESLVGTKTAEEVVDLNSALPADGRDVLVSEFRSFSMRARYRGKFALMFFLKWIECLVAERRRDGGGELFNGLDGGIKIPTISLDTLASRADVPTELMEFLQKIVSGRERKGETSTIVAA